jgi:hypothetical protein
MPGLERFERHHTGWLFRGHRCPKWLLETSLERASRRCGIDAVSYERACYREFRRHAHAYLTRVPNESDTLEWLALMQHYGAPTRLLDFTESFWIGLFFAFEEAEEDCCVIALDRLSLANKNPELDYNELLNQNIIHGSPTFNALFEDVPYYTNDRLAIQKGTFVFALNVQRSFQQLAAEHHKTVHKLIVRKSLFPDIRRRLNDFNCNSRVLFPGIDGYGRYFKNLSITSDEDS